MRISANWRWNAREHKDVQSTFNQVYILNYFKCYFFRHLDDEVLALLDNIKPLFTNVFLVIFSMQSALNDMQIVFTHLLPMLGSIRGIGCDDIGIVEFLEQQFPGTLAQAKELDLFAPKPTSIPACLNWLSAPLDFNLHGPRFLTGYARSEFIFAIVDTVRKVWIFRITV